MLLLQSPHFDEQLHTQPLLGSQVVCTCFILGPRAQVLHAPAVKQQLHIFLAAQEGAVVSPEHLSFCARRRPAEAAAAATAAATQLQQQQ
jgi:hypothetical protein